MLKNGERCYNLAVIIWLDTVDTVQDRHGGSLGPNVPHVHNIFESTELVESAPHGGVGAPV